MLSDDDQGGNDPATDDFVDRLMKTLRPATDDVVDRLVKTLRRRLFPTAIPGLDDATVRRVVCAALLLKCGAGFVSLDRIRAEIERAVPDVVGRDPGPVDEVMARIREYVEVSFWTDK
jgi:hypothetical protein